MNNAIRTAAGCIAFACLASGAAAQKAYKYVDEKGNVTYSQVPPVAKDAAKVDITPAHKGSGGNGGNGGGRQPYYPGSGYFDGVPPQHRHEFRGNINQVREEAERQRMAALEAECNRGRGSDCKNPETLRYLEQQNVPRPVGPGRR